MGSIGRLIFTVLLAVPAVSAFCGFAHPQLLELVSFPTKHKYRFVIRLSDLWIDSPLVSCGSGNGARDQPDNGFHSPSVLIRNDASRLARP